MVDRSGVATPNWPGGKRWGEYLALARDAAARHMPEAGVAGTAAEAGELFDFALRPMQEAAASAPLPKGQMPAFIKDETGAGKAEAALILAQRMLLGGKGRGLFFALPTMATADAGSTDADVGPWSRRAVGAVSRPAIWAQPQR